MPKTGPTQIEWARKLHAFANSGRDKYWRGGSSGAYKGEIEKISKCPRQKRQTGKGIASYFGGGGAGGCQCQWYDGSYPMLKLIPQ